MSTTKLDKADGENICSWCFEKDENVRHHADSDTYWHQHCFEVGSDVMAPMLDWSPKEGPLF